MLCRPRVLPAVLLLLCAALLVGCGGGSGDGAGSSEEGAKGTGDTNASTETSGGSAPAPAPDLTVLREQIEESWSARCRAGEPDIELTSAASDPAHAKSFAGCPQTDDVQYGLHHWDGSAWKEEQVSYTDRGFCPLDREHGSVVRELELSCEAYVFEAPASTLRAEPERLDLTTNASLRNLRWTGWGEAEATATGTYHGVTCTPSCSEGAPVVEDVSVTVSQLRRCQGQIASIDGAAWAYTRLDHTGSGAKDTHTGCPKAAGEIKLEQPPT